MIIYKDITFDQIQIIKELWEKNRIYHEKKSEYFGKQYSDVIFEERMNSFAPLDYNHLKITIAENSENGKILGYCVSAFEGNSGQPHSLHVLEEARGKGIGKYLMNKHLEWLKNNGCINITVTVSYENYSTIEFYKSLGFRSDTIEMKLI